MQVEEGEHDADSFTKPLLKDISLNQDGYNGDGIMWHGTFVPGGFG